MMNKIKLLITSILPLPIWVSRLLYINQLVKRGDTCEIWGGGSFAERFDEAIDKFIDPAARCKWDVAFLRRDMAKCYVKYGVKPSEYFYFDFDKNRNNKYRKSFISDKVKDEACLKSVTFQEYKSELTDKYNFYKKNRKFFKRDCYLVDKSMSASEFVELLKNHKRLFIKQLDGSFGDGAQIVNYETNDQASEFYYRLMSPSDNRYIAEQLLIQSSEFSKWNESSVNTVRIPSIMHNGEHHIIAPFFRTGRKGAIIDNAGGGGILAAVDEETGYIISDGYSEANIYFKCHPDSNLEYIGWRIPRWDELKTLAAAIHAGMPKHKYIAFDFALTDQGWVLIEGNWGQLLWQYATKRGIKKKFLELMSCNI